MAYQRKNLTDIVTFTRASTKTYFGSDGLLKTAAINEWPLEYDPVTLAPQGRSVWEARTNLLTYSENFSNAAWGATGVTISPNSAVAPDGTVTADTMTETSSSNDPRLPVDFSFVAGTTYTFSVFAKVKPGSAQRYLMLVFNTGFTLSGGVNFNLVTGSVGATQNATGTIEDVGSGWYRCTMRHNNLAAGAGGLRIRLANVDTSGNIASPVAYTGDGVSGIYIWGAQLEAGAFATPYIPTPATFTSRASTATYFDVNGVMQTAAINEARNGYGLVNGVWVSKGLELEAAATNLLLRSEEFDNAAWTKNNSSVTPNAVVAPSGVLTADVVIENAAASTQHRLSSGFTGVSGTTYAVSAFVKRVTGVRNVQLGITGTGSVGRAYFDLGTGAVSTIDGSGSPSATITYVGNGWYRVALTATNNLSGSCTVFLANTINTIAESETYSGDGVSSVAWWGAQLEAGSIATSYIPTTSATVTRAADVSSSATVTRAADVAVMTGTNFSDWYNQSEGTFVVDAVTASVPVAAAGRSAIYVSDGTGSNSLQITLYNGASVVAYWAILKGGVDSGTYRPTAGANATKAALAYSSSEASGAALAGTLLNQSSGSTVLTSLPTNRMDIGYSSVVGNRVFCGFIRSIVYYPTRLSNAQLQALSS